METISQKEFESRYGQGSLSDFKNLKERKKPFSNTITDVLGLGGAVDTFGSLIARGRATEEEKQFIEKPTAGQVVGAGLQTAAIPAAALITGGGSLLGQAAAGAGVGYLFDVGSDLIEQKSAAETITPGVGTLAGMVAPPALRGIGAGLNKGTGFIVGAAKRGASAVRDTGLGQVAGELLERVPRAVGRGVDKVAEAKARAERLKTATPEVQTAIKSGLDDVVIDAVEQADDATKEAYKRMVEIAEQPRSGLRPATRPESVAGEVVSDQYTILDSQRKEVGKQIGEVVDELSKQKGAVDVLPAQRTMRDILRQNGILPDASGTLKFEGTKYTPAQRTVIQQLYKLATEGGEQLTPRQVYNKDQLFSQLQRETRFSDVGDVIIDVPEGSMSLFRAFRNVYSSQLDQIAPEIASLNKQYRQLKILEDDLEKSIVKSGNFETTKGVDPAEFAQTNLRRLFSDAQSAADYRQIYDNLDAVTRELGYQGPRADDLAGFATRLRQIYPETTPETSFSGGISGGVRNVIGNVLKMGEADVVDQQKALKILLGF